jgi:hypothetical protein
MENFSLASGSSFENIAPIARVEDALRNASEKASHALAHLQIVIDAAQNPDETGYINNIARALATLPGIPKLTERINELLRLAV